MLRTPRRPLPYFPPNYLCWNTAGFRQATADNIYIPSAPSIPSVSIMAAEPATRREGPEAAATSTSRRPAAAKEEERAAGNVNSGGIRGAPLQISPGAQ